MLFLGSSHVLNALDPMQMYAQYGITSYNMAKHGGIMPESYWELVNALDYCSPKCVIIDLWALDRDYHFMDVMEGDRPQADLDNSVALVHKNFDFWPLSKHKIAAVNDLIAEPSLRTQFLWDFSLYHDRWDVLDAGDFGAGQSTEFLREDLGSRPRDDMEANYNYWRPDDLEQQLDHETVCVQYLRKTIELCRDKNICVILTFLPVAGAKDLDIQAVNTGKVIGGEYDIPVIDLLTGVQAVNYTCDMADDSHLNISGMYKVTDYFGRLLSQEYGLEDHRIDNDAEVWSELLDGWQNRQVRRLLDANDLYACLSRIYTVNASAVIYLRADSKALHDTMVREKIFELTGSKLVEDAAVMNGPYILIRDRSMNGPEDTEFSGAYSIPDSFPTILGDTIYIGFTDFAALYNDGVLENNLLDMDEQYRSDAQILILGQDGEIIGRKYFSLPLN